MIAQFWRHGLWENIEHITTKLGQCPGKLLLEKCIPVSCFTKKHLPDSLVFGFFWQVSMFCFLLKLSLEKKLIIKKIPCPESFFVMKKKAFIKSCSIKEIFFKQVSLNVAALNLTCVKVFILVQFQASYLHLYLKMNTFRSILQFFLTLSIEQLFYTERLGCFFWKHYL